MNHITKSFTASDGTVHKCHSWELREGGYRREALIVGNGLWPSHKETRLVNFLLERGFRVLALDLAFGSPQAPRSRLKAFRETVADFAREASPLGLPLYIVASSFSASALLPVAARIPAIAALALVAPVVEFPLSRMKMPPFFLSTAELVVEREDLSGVPELLDGFFEGKGALKFHKRDLKAVSEELGLFLGEAHGLPTAAFAGEADPYLSQEGRLALVKAGIKVYGYPRVKREPGRDRYADNYFADLGSFIDEVEARHPAAELG